MGDMRYFHYRPLCIQLDRPAGGGEGELEELIPLELAADPTSAGVAGVRRGSVAGNRHSSTVAARAV